MKQFSCYLLKRLTMRVVENLPLLRMLKRALCCRGVLRQHSSSFSHVPDGNKARVEAVFEFAFLGLRRPTNMAEEYNIAICLKM